MDYSDSECISEQANPPLNLGICTDFDCMQAEGGCLPLTLVLSSSNPAMQNKCRDRNLLLMNGNFQKRLREKRHPSVRCRLLCLLKKLREEIKGRTEKERKHRE